MKPDRFTLKVIVAASLLALLVAKNHAGGWNDGSRLATVEALIDHGTWAIDDSVFTRTASERAHLRTDPYGDDSEKSVPRGTLDKLYIGGHYYSDKSPVPALPMAGAYWLWRTAGGTSFVENASATIWFLTVTSSGLAYVLAIVAIDSLARRRLDQNGRLLVVASFALSTVALPYTEAVNNHILLLAACSWLLVLIDSFDFTTSKLAAIGALAGVAYSIDLGAGPVICLGVGMWTLSRTRSFTSSVVVVLAALPFIALHHWLNYRIGGSWKPANAIPEYFNWPGCPFNASNMTGGWRHTGFGAFLLYAADLLLGRRGFLNSNLPLHLAVIGVFVMWKHASGRRLELSLCAFWGVGVWLIYAATSTNLSGECCSVRWFVPLLAPGYYVLIQLLHHRPETRSDMVWLSMCGALLAAGMAVNGPWSGRMPWAFWFILPIAGIGWGRIARRRNISAPPSVVLRRAA